MSHPVLRVPPRERHRPTRATASRPWTGRITGTHLAGSRLLSIASAQPEHTVTAETLGRPFGRSADWIQTRTGIDEVRRLAVGGDIVALAGAAARTALDRAGLTADDIDLVITASCSITADDSTQIAAAAAPRAGRMAINSACSGFCYALSTADDLLRTGVATTVLIIAVEHMSSLLDTGDLGTSIVFGDGVGAAVVGRVAPELAGVGPIVSGSDGAQGGLIACGDDGLLQMAGRDVFRWAVETVPDLALETCRRAGLDLADLVAFVPHQANKRIIDAVVTRLGLTHQLVTTDITRSGNTSAASIPIALDQLLLENPTISGGYALLFGFGAGLAYAGQVVRLP